MFVDIILYIRSRICRPLCPSLLMNLNQIIHIKSRLAMLLLFLTFSVFVANPKKTTLHGGQSRSWSAEQGKENISLVMRGLSVILTLQPKFLDRFRSYVDL